MPCCGEWESGQATRSSCQAFTCVAVANAVMYVGATPRYVDIDAATLTVDVPAIEAVLASNTKVILAQNTFGLSPDIDAILALAKKRGGIRVIDDCAHGFGGRYKGMPNGAIADASFFSTQWNKPYSTGLRRYRGYERSRTRLRTCRSRGEFHRPVSARDRPVAESAVCARSSAEAEIVLAWYLGISRTQRAESCPGIILGRGTRGAAVGAELPEVDVSRPGQAQVDELRHVGADVAHRVRVAKRYEDVVTELGASTQTGPQVCRPTATSASRSSSRTARRS